MAQLERERKSPKDGYNMEQQRQQHHLAGHQNEARVRWATLMGNNHDQEEAPDHIKKSVITKVKEKAKKWRHNLANNNKKKHNNITSSTTTPWGVSSSLDRDDDAHDTHYHVEAYKEAQHFGAPMYELEQAHDPKGISYATTTATSHPPMVSDKHVMETHKKHPIITRANMIHDDDKHIPVTSKTILTEKLGPDYAKDSDETTMPSTSLSSSASLIKNNGVDQMSSGGEHKWDKGVSVKEYLIKKLEPGEEERALSEVISDAISPRTITGETGVVEKVREAVSSMLGIEQATPLSSPHIPISTNAQEVLVEENQERRLQANN